MSGPVLMYFEAEDVMIQTVGPTPNDVSRFGRTHLPIRDYAVEFGNGFLGCRVETLADMPSPRHRGLGILP